MEGLLVVWCLGKVPVCLLCHKRGKVGDCLIFQEPCDDACSLRVLKVPSWRGVGSVPDNHEAREWGGLFHRDWFCLTDILHSGLWLASLMATDGQPIVRMPNHWDMKSHRLDMLYPLRTSPEIHTRANPQYRMDQVGNAADQQFLGRALMWTLLQVCWSLSPIWDSPDRITYEVVSLSIWRAEYRKYFMRQFCNRRVKDRQ